MEDLIIYIIILILSVIQSVFGVGILLFGTPTFIYLGYDFFETLNLLIPCSLLVSLMQILLTKNKIKHNIFFF